MTDKTNKQEQYNIIYASYNWELPNEFKKQWIKALKSGDYLQGTGALSESSGSALAYCCLGVACSVAGVNDYDIHGEWIDDWNGDFCEIPEILKGSADDNKLVRILSEMNDNLSETDVEEHVFNFSDIANWIDRYIKGIK